MKSFSLPCESPFDYFKSSLQNACRTEAKRSTISLYSQNTDMSP